MFSYIVKVYPRVFSSHAKGAGLEGFIRESV
jgi:hypothetical protein